MDISAPKNPSTHPDRDIDAQASLEPSFQAVIEAAIAAGWTEVEASEAMLGLAKAQIAAISGQDSEVDLEGLARSTP